VLVLSALLPPALIAALIHLFAVNVPYWDQWNNARLFQAIEEGSFGWSDLLAQHNEHRILVPRLICLILARLSGWNIVLELYFSFALAVATLWFAYRTGLRSLRGDGDAALTCLVLASPLLFSLVQWENWFSGFQMQFFIPVASLFGSLLLAGTSRSLATKAAGMIALATLNTWTLASGIASFVLLLPALLVSSPTPISRSRGVLAAWFGAMAANGVAYFAGYGKPAHHPSALLILERPLDGLQYFLCYLGAPFAYLLGNDPQVVMVAAQVIAVVELAVFGACVWACACFGRDRARWAQVVPWLTAGGWALVSAASTTVGRLGFGVDQATSSRYATFASLLGVADLYLVAILLPRFERSVGTGRGQRLASVLATLLVAASLASSFHEYAKLDALRMTRLMAKALLAFVQVLPDDRLIAELLHAEVAPLKSAAASLDRQGLLRPKLLTSDRIREIEAYVPMNEYGAIEASSVAGDFLRASGWAALPNRKAPADALLLCFEGADGDRRVFAFATNRGKRPDVAKRPGLSGLHTYYGWRASIPISQLPAEASAFSVYAFDALENRAFRLEGVIPRSP
jgi:hypothetical protein